MCTVIFPNHLQLAGGAEGQEAVMVRNSRRGICDLPMPAFTREF